MRQRKALDIQENGKQFNEMLLWQPSGVSVRGENGNGEFTKGRGLGRLKSYQWGELDMSLSQLDMREGEGESETNF